MGVRRMRLGYRAMVAARAAAVCRSRPKIRKLDAAVLIRGEELAGNPARVVR